MDKPTTLTPPYLTPVRESEVPGMGSQALCPNCKEWCGARGARDRFRAGTLSIHFQPRGMLCDGAERTITLQAAVSRDSLLNAEEEAARSHAYRHAVDRMRARRDGRTL